MLKAKEVSMPLYMAFVNYKRHLIQSKHKQYEKRLVELLETLYKVQRATVRVDSEYTDWFEMKKGVCPGYLISPSLSYHSAVTLSMFYVSR